MAPLPEYDFISSPMSVGSTKSDASSQSLADIKKLATLSLSLNSSHNSDDFQEGVSIDGSTKDALSPTPGDISGELTPSDKPDFGFEGNNSEMNLIDAMLTGMFSEFSGLNKRDGNEFNDVDINLLDENTFLSIIENEDNDELLDLAEESLPPLQRSLSSPSPKMETLLPPVRANPLKPSSRGSRLKSESSVLRGGVESRVMASHPYSRVENEMPGSFKRRHTVDGKASMYFENKGYFRFRARFRDLVRREVHSGNLTANQLAMKSSRLFLNMLTKHYEWVGESVESAVKNDKEINMENFTKRKITILDNIPPEHVSCLRFVYVQISSRFTNHSCSKISCFEAK